MKALADKHEVSAAEELKIGENLEEFLKTNTFQSGILAFIVGLKSTSEDLEQLNQMFLMLDESKDGLLSVEEIKKGMDEVFGKLLGDTGMDYRELVKSLDRDNNGVIDY